MNERLLDKWEETAMSLDVARKMLADFCSRTYVLKTNSRNIDWATWLEQSRETDKALYARLSRSDMEMFQRFYNRPPVSTFAPNLLGEIYAENVNGSQLLGVQTAKPKIPVLFVVGEDAIRLLLQHTHLGGSCTVTTPFFRNLHLADDLLRKEKALTYIIRSEDGRYGKCFAVFAGIHPYIPPTWAFDAAEAAFEGSEFGFYSLTLSNMAVDVEYRGRAEHGMTPYIIVRDSDTGNSLFTVDFGWVMEDGNRLLVSRTSLNHSRQTSLDQYTEEIRQVLQRVANESPSFAGKMHVADETEPLPFEEIKVLLSEVYQGAVTKSRFQTVVASAIEDCESAKTFGDQIRSIIKAQEMGEHPSIKAVMLKSTMKIPSLTDLKLANH